LDDPQLDGRIYSLEVGNRPTAYILEEENTKLSLYSSNKACHEDVWGEWH
jgi:hypothetical protein